MFDKLEDLLQRFEEILNELSEPSVTSDQKRFTALMKEQSDLTPIVEAYKEYKQCKQDIEDSLALLDEETDEDMREMLKDELASAKDRVEELENTMKILLLPKDPNDDKNVIVEIRAGPGGDDAAETGADQKGLRLWGPAPGLRSQHPHDPGGCRYRDQPHGGLRGPVPGPAGPAERRTGSGMGKQSLRQDRLRHGPGGAQHKASAGGAGGPGKVPPEPVEDHQRGCPGADLHHLVRP